MAKAEKMGDGRARAGAVIGADAVDGKIGFELALQRDEGTFEIRLPGPQRAVILARGHNEERIDPAAVEVAHIGRIDAQVVVGAHDQQRITRGLQHVFGPGDDLSGEWSERSEATNPIRSVAPRRKLRAM
jgi:hypothetical protein